jgi:hypothetical protein
MVPLAELVAAPSESAALESNTRREVRRHLSIIDSRKIWCRREDRLDGCGKGSIVCCYIASPVRVLGENVIAALHQRVAGKPALRVVSLRRCGGLGCGRKRIGCRVVIE